jgi:2-polyprenyl-3-methyl-5-hydroxy-6-metoxy-1,4-benzoquinol methylase
MNYRKQFYNQYVTLQVRPRGGSFTEQDYLNWANGALKHIQGWLPDDHAVPILDVGCGSGKLLYLFQQLGYVNLTGVDLSPEQIQLAQSRFSQATIIQGDVREFLKDRVEQYSLICAFDVIEHFRKEEVLPFLELIFQSLRPGGRLILQTPNAESPWFGSVAYGDFTHEWFFTPHGLEHVLRLVGFEQFQARESGPYVHGAKSLIRHWLWRLIHLGLAAWNLAEMGGAGSRIYSRVFVATVVKN